MGNESRQKAIRRLVYKGRTLADKGFLASAEVHAKKLMEMGVTEAEVMRAVVLLVRAGKIVMHRPDSTPVSEMLSGEEPKPLILDRSGHAAE